VGGKRVQIQNWKKKKRGALVGKKTIKGLFPDEKRKKKGQLQDFWILEGNKLAKRRINSGRGSSTRTGYPTCPSSKWEKKELKLTIFKKKPDWPGRFERRDPVSRKEKEGHGLEKRGGRNGEKGHRKKISSTQIASAWKASFQSEKKKEPWDKKSERGSGCHSGKNLSQQKKNTKGGYGNRKKPDSYT